MLFSNLVGETLCIKIFCLLSIIGFIMRALEVKKHTKSAKMIHMAQVFSHQVVH